MTTSYVWWSIAGGLILFLAAHFVCWQDRQYPRHRVDWEHVYSMEVDCYGHTFDHAGAPPPSSVRFDGERYHTRRSVPISYYNIENTVKIRHETLSKRLNALDYDLSTYGSRSPEVARRIREDRASTWQEMRKLIKEAGLT